MKSTLLKKGKTAVALAVSLAMIFATASYPVSVAKAETSATVPVVTALSDKQEGTDLSGSYTLPAGYNFIYIKQANGANVLWTLDDISGYWGWGDTIDIGVYDKKAEPPTPPFDGPDYESFKAFMGEFWDVLNPDSDLKDPSIIYIHGTEDSPFIFKADEPGQYQYEFTEEEGVITFTYDPETVSHFYSGEYYTPENPTVSLDFLKVLDGLTLEEGMFSFALYSAEWDDTDDELDMTGLIQTVTNDADGNVVFDDLEFDTAGTYYFIIKELPDDETPVEGVVYDTHVVTLTVTVAEVEGVLEAEAAFDGSKTFTNTYNEEEYGQITVTKNVTFPENEQPETFTKDFYFTLFELDDEDLTPVATKMVSYAGDYDPEEELSVTFTGLELDKTYVVYETDGANYPNDGEDNIIDPAEDLTVGPWINILYENQEIELTTDETTGAATVTNVFDPGDFGLEGSIIVNKTVTKNGKLWATDKKFYVALFADEELTQRVTEPKTLDMKNDSKTSVEFTSADIDEDYVNPEATYYIAETNSAGVAITDSLAQYGFVIEQDTTSVTAKDLLAEDITINLINKYKEEEFPVTGDSTNMNLWLFLAVLGVAGAIAPFALRKREEIND